MFFSNGAQRRMNEPRSWRKLDTNPSRAQQSTANLGLRAGQNLPCATMKITKKQRASS